MATGGRIDPYKGYKFRLEIDGVIRGGFREVSGLDGEPGETGDHKEAVTEPRQIPGLKKYGNITLKRGVTDDHSPWDWQRGAATAKTQRKNGSIILADESGKEEARWNFVNAWPTKWTGPSLNATAGEVAIDTLEIAHEGLTRG